MVIDCGSRLACVEQLLLIVFKEFLEEALRLIGTSVELFQH